jgi:hypothetical protein
MQNWECMYEESKELERKDRLLMIADTSGEVEVVARFGDRSLRLHLG